MATLRTRVNVQLLVACVFKKKQTQGLQYASSNVENKNTNAKEYQIGLK